MPRSAARRLVVVLACAALVASCSSHDLAFRNDDPIQIVKPQQLQVVKPPFVMRWVADVPPTTTYAVFIDRAPMAPGQSLREYAAAQCDGTTDCPDGTADSLASWVRQRGIFTTKTPRLEIPFVTSKGDTTEKDTRDTHEAIVVLLGPDGHRTGESAGDISFRVPRPDFG